MQAGKTLVQAKFVDRLGSVRSVDAWVQGGSLQCWKGYQKVAIGQLARLGPMIGLQLCDVRRPWRHPHCIGWEHYFIIFCMFFRHNYCKLFHYLRSRFFSHKTVSINGNEIYPNFRNIVMIENHIQMTSSGFYMPLFLAACKWWPPCLAQLFHSNYRRILNRISFIFVF